MAASASSLLAASASSSCAAISSRLPRGAPAAASVPSPSRQSCPSLRASQARRHQRRIVASVAPTMQPPAESKVSTVVDVDLGDRSYPIYIGAGLLEEPDLLQRHVHGKRVLVVTNTTVAPIYLEKVTWALTHNNPNVSVESVILPDGEKYKDMDTLMKVFDKAIETRLDRRCTFVALGGGVIGDMCGFAASAFLRGVNFIQIPTTLMAQVDSSVGGKTGINHPLGKNLIGAFYQPQCVLIDTNTLNTLPDRELASGIAEVVKYGLIRDAPFFEWQEQNMSALLARAEHGGNEVINDLLDPTGQNLRIREDAQGTYVEGIKEEVVLSPAHALSLIASGEEHRHVGSNNFNLVSSRSHTIFTLTIESSPSGESDAAEEVKLSQLNLIDLAGSESSKTETTGLRRKEGSYINKSLLTLGTVIAKLTDGKATHIPYRDSKLTRLLQYSLSGHGRISLICTVTPASSNSEETHNTLKFAHRSKHVEIKASQNKIIDEKSLIKKYQKEISCLKEELQQLRRGMMGNGCILPTDQEDLVNLKLQLEAGQVKLQSRLEQEEEAKAALMGRIQRLTKLILVSTKSSISSNVSGKTNLRRRHSFGEDELVYLPDRKREYFVDDDDISLDSELSLEGKLDPNNPDESARFDRRNRKRGMLGWFKLKKSDQLSGLSSSVDGDSNASGSPSCSKSSQQKNLLLDLKDGRRKSMTRKGDDPTTADSFLERTQAGDLFSAASRARHPPPSGTTIVDQIDLLQEQVKMLAGEVALCTSSLKRLSEQAANNPDDVQIQEQIEKLREEIAEKKSHIHLLEQRMVQSLEIKEDPATKTELSQTFSKLSTQLSEKTFELEIMSADNRILQDQLQAKVTENAELRELVAQFRQEISSLKAAKSEDSFASVQSSEPSTASTDSRDNMNEISNHANMPSRTTEGNESGLISQVLKQASEIENLKQDNLRLAEEKDGLEIQSQKLAEESSYAKELASAAAVELKNLAEEVTRLSYENAKLNADLAAAKEQTASVSRSNIHNDTKRRDHENGILVEELQKELISSCQREAVLEDTLSQKDRRESELLKIIEDAKWREHELENELASMWVLVSKIKKESSQEDVFEFKAKQNGFHSSKADGGRLVNEMQASDNGSWDGLSTMEEARAAYNFERRRCKELESVVSRLKGEDLRGLDVKVLEELQNFHVEALSRICQEKMASQVL